MNERPQRLITEPIEEPRITTPVWLGAGALAAVLAAVAIWFFLIREPELPPVDLPTTVDEPVAPVVQPPSPAVPRPVPVPQPLPAPEPVVNLPPLAASDSEFAAALGESVGAAAAEQHLNPGDLIRKLVVTVDNLARPTLPLERRLVQATPGLFVVDGPEDARRVSEENYARYAPFMTLLSAADARTVVAIYRRYYPLLQEAYLELGNPTPEFATRVVEVIDNLLAAPEVTAPLDLVQPKVLYEYRDPALERRSSGQKILMRIGPEHARLVKARLREIRALLLQ